MGGHSARDVALTLIETAWASGKVVADGVWVKKDWGSMEVEAKVSRRTLSKALVRLEEWDFGCRVKEDRKPGNTGAFVLRADVNQYEEGEGVESGRTPNGLHLRAPRLRWSSPGSKPRRGLVSSTRRVRQSAPRKARPAVKRLGKIRGAIIDVLDVGGGL